MWLGYVGTMLLLIGGLLALPFFPGVQTKEWDALRNAADEALLAAHASSTTTTVTTAEMEEVIAAVRREAVNDRSAAVAAAEAAAAAALAAAEAAGAAALAAVQTEADELRSRANALSSVLEESTAQYVAVGDAAAAAQAEVATLKKALAEANAEGVRLRSEHVTAASDAAETVVELEQRYTAQLVAAEAKFAALAASFQPASVHRAAAIAEAARPLAEMTAERDAAVEVARRLTVESAGLQRTLGELTDAVAAERALRRSASPPAVAATSHTITSQHSATTHSATAAAASSSSTVSISTAAHAASQREEEDGAALTALSNMAHALELARNDLDSARVAFAQEKAAWTASLDGATPAAAGAELRRLRSAIARRTEDGGIAAGVDVATLVSELRVARAALSEAKASAASREATMAQLETEAASLRRSLEWVGGVKEGGAPPPSQDDSVVLANASRIASALMGLSPVRGRVEGRAPPPLHHPRPRTLRIRVRRLPCRVLRGGAPPHRPRPAAPR